MTGKKTENSTEKSAVDQESLTDQELSVGQESSTGQESSAGQESSTNQKPSTDKTSSAEREASTVEASSADQKNSIDQNTSTDPKPSVTQESSSIDSKDEKNTASDKTASSVATGRAKNKPEKNKSSNKKAKSLPLIMIWVFVLIFILFVGLGVGVYYGWQFWLTQNDRISQLETGSGEQNKQLLQYSQKINAEAKALKQQQGNLAQLQKDQRLLQERLDSHTQRLRALAGTSREDWLLAEARYLLRLANQRIIVEQGTSGAQSLLAAADKILVSMDNSDLLPVRDAIAKEMIELKLASAVDKQGLYLQLAAIKQQIQALPFIPKRPEALEKENEPTSAIEEKPTDLNWHQRLVNSFQGALDGMKQYVDVIPHDQVPVLLMDESQKIQIINNISLMFEQAQFALLHEQEKIYQNSLLQAIDWWQIYYSHYAEYEVIQSELKKLAAISIVQELPDISRSSKLLTDHIERFHKLNVAPENTTSTGEQGANQ